MQLFLRLFICRMGFFFSIIQPQMMALPLGINHRQPLAAAILVFVPADPGVPALIVFLYLLTFYPGKVRPLHLPKFLMRIAAEVLRGLFPPVASARDGSTAPQVSGGYLHQIPAIAPAAPQNILPAAGPDPFQHQQPPEALTERDVYEERVMLGLRTKYGVPAEILPKGALERLVRGGLMTIEGGRARVTQAGSDVLNAVILELI